jgi:hypothetical protein
MMDDGEQSSVHSLLQSSDESTDLERLFLLFGRLRFLQAQVPKPIGDEVELAKDDPRARLHLLRFIAEVKDN